MSAARVTCLAALLALAAGLPARAAEAPDGLRARLALRACAAAVREGSVRLCRQALELGLSPPRAAVAQRLLGRSLANLTRWDEAATAYREAWRLEPGDAESSFRLGLVLHYGLDRAAEAEPLLRQALGACPDEPTYHVELALALSTLGRHSAAAAEFQAALALDERALDARPAAQATYLAALREALWP